MRIFQRTAALLALGVLAFGALALSTGAGANRVDQSRLASVNVVKILQEMMQTPEYAEPRETKRQAMVSEIQSLQDELQRMGQELSMIPPTDQERGQKLYQEYQQKQQDYRELSQQRSQEYQKLSGEQAAQIYDRIYKAVQTVASGGGYTHVFSTQPGGTLEQADSLNGVTQGILTRPLIIFPEADDLTDLVRKQIGYQVPAETPPADATPAQPADSNNTGSLPGNDSGNGG